MSIRDLVDCLFLYLKNRTRPRFQLLLASRVNVGLMEALVEIYYSDGETRKTNN